MSHFLTLNLWQSDLSSSLHLFRSHLGMYRLIHLLLSPNFTSLSFISSLLFSLLFVFVDPTGMIRHSTINDLPVGRNVDEALRLIKAFQFVEKHGEVCPANWQPGAATMNPDPIKSKEYFQKVHSSSSSSSSSSGMDET